jgi:hypothetical protein
MASLTVMPTQKVMAGGGDALLGGVIGGVVGGIIVNEANKNHRRRTVVVQRTTTVSPYTRAQNRETQTALNYFGFPAGVPDGVMGRRSRAAVADYQALLGYPASGYMTEYQRQVLVTSYNRAVAQGGLTAQRAAASPMGMRGVLLEYRDEMAGISHNNGPTTAAVPVAQPAAPPEATAAAQTAPAPADDSALPNFLGNSAMQVSLASHCNKVSLQTSSNGGFVTAATMHDANFALNEQFCLARTYAMSEGEDMMRKVQGYTPQQIQKQCESFGPAMKDEISALSLQPRDEVLQEVSAFAMKSGIAPAQLAATAKICLSVGYRIDDMNVAIASALLLTALGDKVYAELLGHHLAEGFGTSKRPDLALAWYQESLGALSNGAQAVFVPGQPDRTTLIRKAAYAVAGKADAGTAPVAADAPASALPNFAAPAQKAVAQP